jgi:hypothetical protein
MATLDNPNVGIDESTVPFFPTALKYGVIAGLILVAYSMLGNMLGFSIPTSLGMGVIQMIIGILAVVLIGYFTIKHHRDRELGGYISFGRAFLVCLIALVTAGLISSIFNYIYMTFIDPDYVNTALEKMEEMFSSMGMSEDQIEEALKGTRERFEPSTMLTTGLLWSIGINAIIALIMAAIMKKRPAEFAV